MTRKSIYPGIIGFFISLLLLFSSASYADQYYLHFQASSFIPGDESYDYQTVNGGEYLYNADSMDAFFFNPIHFNKSSTGIYYIKSISIRYFDSLTDGYVYVELKRKNLFTGVIHTVANWSSGTLTTTPSPTVAHKGTNDGYKLIDTLKFSYHLYAYFVKEGPITPGNNERLYQVRVHYGT